MEISHWEQLGYPILKEKATLVWTSFHGEGDYHSMITYANQVAFTITLDDHPPPSGPKCLYGAKLEVLFGYSY